MPKCVVIGIEGKAREVRDLLNTSDVPTEAFAHNLGIARIADSCSKMKGLKVVVVFCGDFGMDGGIKLFTVLKKTLSESVALHALLEANEDQSMVDLLNETGVEEVSFAQPLTLNPFKAASFIKRRWFPRNGSEVSVATVPSRVISVARQVIEPDREEDDGDVSSAVLTKPTPVVARRPVARVPRVTAPIKDGSVGVLSRLMLKTRRNSPSSHEPEAISIVGKHGQTVQMDPRRIRPLPENPRGEENLGFSETNLRQLGTKIKTIGQLEEIMVCPIVGNSDFDAQLVDGECRQRATKLAGVMVWVTVREDITPEDAEKLYLMSVMRNLQKQKHTTREYVRIVSNLRGEKYGMTLMEVAECVGISVTRVQQLEALGQLHPSVQKMLDDTPDEEGAKKSRGMARRFTSQLALLLVDISKDKQCAVAEEIKAKKMNFATARRFVYNIRRGLGLTQTPVGTRHSRQFESLEVLVLRSMETFGIFYDMSNDEFAPILRSRTVVEKDGLCKNLRSLIQDLEAIAKRIETGGAIK